MNRGLCLKRRHEEPRGHLDTKLLSGRAKTEGLEALGLGYRTGLAEVQARPKRQA